MRRLLALALALLPVAAGADPALDAEERELLRLVNAYRAAHGLPCLSPSPTAASAADAHSRAMGEEDFFSHREPPCDGDGTTCTGRDPFERLRDHGHVGWTAAAENIAAGYPTAAEVLEAWKGSPGHDANLRGARFTAIGIGRADVPGSRYGVYWTNTFSDRADGPERCDDPAGGGGGGGGNGGGGSLAPGLSDGGGTGGGCAAGQGAPSLAGPLLALLFFGSRRRP